MGISTLKQLRDEIVLLAAIKGNPDYPPTLVDRRINHSARYVQTELNGLGAKRWETSQSISAGLTAAAYNYGTNNVKTVAIGTTYFPRMLETPQSIIHIDVTSSVLEDVSSPHGIAREVSIKNFEEQLFNTFLAPTITKPVFMRLAQKIWLAPLSIIGAIAYYYKAIADLVVDADITEIPVEFEDFIIKKAVLEIKNMKGEIQEMQVKQAELDKEIRQSYERFLGKMAETGRVELQNNAKLQ